MSLHYHSVITLLYSSQDGGENTEGASIETDINPNSQVMFLYNYGIYPQLAS